MLGSLGDPRAVKPLIHLLKTDEYVAEILLKINDPKAIEPQNQAIQEKDSFIQNIAQVVLMKLHHNTESLTHMI